MEDVLLIFFEQIVSICAILLNTRCEKVGFGIWLSNTTEKIENSRGEVMFVVNTTIPKT